MRTIDGKYRLNKIKIKRQIKQTVEASQQRYYDMSKIRFNQLEFEG